MVLVVKSLFLDYLKHFMLKHKMPRHRIPRPSGPQSLLLLLEYTREYDPMPSRPPYRGRGFSCYHYTPAYSGVPSLGSLPIKEVVVTRKAAPPV